VTLALDAVVVAGGIFLGRLIARVVRRKGRDAPDTTEDASQPQADAGQDIVLLDAPGATQRIAELLEGFPCKLGDVVVRQVEGDEAWLASALLFVEERPVAVLFVAPEARGDRAVLAPAPAQAALTWLSPIDARPLALGADPPRTLEHAGLRFQRTRRLPVRVRRLGMDAPRVGDRAVLGEYAAAGADRLVVVVGPEASRAWRGVTLSPREYEVLPGGQATLKP
jgi:hypothetical protein